jgi:catechol 2,3-dioxygenase
MRGPELVPDSGPGTCTCTSATSARASRSIATSFGFEVMVNLGNAAFVSAGGYHHHLDFNVWMGRDVMPPPPGTVGLRHWTVVLDGAKQVAAVRARVQAAGLPIEERGAAGGFLVRDPWRIAVAFEPVPVT